MLTWADDIVSQLEDEDVAAAERYEKLLLKQKNESMKSVLGEI